jgi:prepilin peptidase CpaA
MVLNAIGAMGAGDSKFIASAAPFVAMQDAWAVLFLLATSFIAAFAVHRLFRAIPAIRNLVPDWQSWTEKRRFPMGFPLGVTLILYLAHPLIQG